MLIVDSSVWIDWLRGHDTEAVRFLQQREASEELALTQMIYLEVLQGMESERQFRDVQRVLSAQAVFRPMDDVDSFEAAAIMYRRCRKAGFTIRKSTNCLIAVIAMEQNALLVHNDRDFLVMAEVEPHLQVIPRRPIERTQ
jgi:predicted nucleic acid-binding protein